MPEESNARHDERIVIVERTTRARFGALWVITLGLAVIALIAGLVFGLGSFGPVKSVVIVLLLTPMPGAMIWGGVITVWYTRCAPALTADAQGVTVADGIGKPWRFGWDTIVWIGLETAVLPNHADLLLVAELTPDAPPVRRRGGRVPVWYPKANAVWLLSLTYVEGDRDALLAGLRQLAGTKTKWRQ